MSEIFKRPTITESETIREEEAHGTNFWLGFRKGFERAGGQIIPDPPPTNLEKLLRIIGRFEVFDADGREAAHQIAQILDNNNVFGKGNRYVTDHHTNNQTTRQHQRTLFGNTHTR